MERFQPVIGGDGAGEGNGGDQFLKSDVEAGIDGSKSILDAGEEAGLKLDSAAEWVSATRALESFVRTAARPAQWRGPRGGGRDRCAF